MMHEIHYKKKHIANIFSDNDIEVALIDDEVEVKK